MDAGVREPQDTWTRLLAAGALSETGTELRVIPSSQPRYAQPALPLHPKLSAALQRLGIEDLYEHQAEALDRARNGESVAVLTGTNSGKTLCYSLPVLERCLEEPMARALLVYPTKALAQDQLAKLQRLARPLGIRAGIYDGDTSVSQRALIRKNAQILLTNPDMLHVGILPHHETWSKFFRSLRYVVLDEAHSYRGVFGAHVANIVRRLMRLCEWQRSTPNLIACSATIGNPESFFQRLAGRRLSLIAGDAAGRATRTLAFLDPTCHEMQPEVASANVRTGRLLACCCSLGLRTLAFCRARVSVELVLRISREALTYIGGDPMAIESYRGGYTPEERRKIEAGLFDGSLLGIATTNALELGVDIGDLDAVILNGHPGTVSSFWQQVGRAGRGTRPGIGMFLAHEDPLETFIARQPEAILSRAAESVCFDSENPQVLAQQLRCAAYERALAPTELERFGDRALETAESLDAAGELQFRAGRFYYPSYEPPAPQVGIRSSGGDRVVLRSAGVALGDMERWRAMRYAHQGAVYLHRGRTFVVESLDLKTSEARLNEQPVDYYTQPMAQVTLQPSEPFADEQWGDQRVQIMPIRATSQVVGFRKLTLDGRTVLDLINLDLPEETIDTIGLRLDALSLAEDQALRIGTLHGVEHALVALAPLVAGCDRTDLGSAFFGLTLETQRPALYIFDSMPGGMGLSEELFRRRREWALEASRMLDACDCPDGCPACLMSTRCEFANENLHKRGTIRLLQSLL